MQAGKYRTVKFIIDEELKAGRSVIVSFTKKNGEIRVMRLKWSQALCDSISNTRPERNRKRRATLKYNYMGTVPELVTYETGTEKYRWKTINYTTVQIIKLEDGTMISFESFHTKKKNRKK